MTAEPPLKATPELLGVNQGARHEGQLVLDLGNLMAFDPAPVDVQALREDPDAFLHSLTTSITQSLFHEVFALPSEPVDVGMGRMATLPAPTTPLPRELPLPKPRPPTKWEKFAQMKGIQKRKRSKLVLDENSGEYKRRHGYKRAGHLADIAVIDAKPTDKPGFDPFAEMEKEKRERLKKNVKQQHANLKRTAKEAGKAALPAAVRLTAGALAEEGRGKRTKRKELAPEIASASLQAGVSTASMGKFDRRLRGEKEGERQHKAVVSKRRKFLPVSDRTGAERKAVAGVVGRIVRERADDILDIDRAVGRVEQAARHARTDEKLRGAREGGAGKKGKRAKGSAKGSANGTVKGATGVKGGKVKKGGAKKAGGGGPGKAKPGGKGVKSVKGRAGGKGRK